jgi:hypothetical protein
LPLFYPMKKFSTPLAIFGFATLVFLSGCAQGDTASSADPANTPESEVVPDGVRKAARFAVKRVVSTPVRVAMTAAKVAEKISERAESKESRT